MAFQTLKHRSTIYRIAEWVGVVSISAVTLFGCSTKAPIPLDSSATNNGYRKDAPYNRPYKVRGNKYYPLTDPEGYKERGIASWYGAESGHLTAMGTKFRPQGLTAAHKTLPLPSRVRVTNLHNGRSIVLVVNDRGPFVKNRLIDLSQGAARAIGIRGLAKVEGVYLKDQSPNVNSDINDRQR